MIQLRSPIAFGWIAGVLGLLMLVGCVPRITLFRDGGDPLQEQVLEGEGKEKILVIPITGFISDADKAGILRSRPGMVRDVVSHLRKAEKDPAVRAVLLKIDSPGGTVTASDMLYHELSEYKTRTRVKLGAAMMSVAASGGYYAALSADWIMAHPTTVTGSVGVIFAQPKVDGLMDRIGVDVQIYKTGTYKDMGSLFRDNTPEESAILDQMVKNMGNRFQELVRTRRSLGPDAMKQIATARIFSADEALDLKMIDHVGYLPDALKHLKSMAGIPDDARVVVYRRSEYAEDNIYNPAAALAGAEPFSLIDLNLLETPYPTPGFHYLYWP